MPEYASALEKPLPVAVPAKKNYRASKYWMLAKKKNNNQHMQLTNSCTEWEYHQLLKEVKKLYAPRGEFVFERDYKLYVSDNLFKMYDFQCDSLFLSLWCCFSEYYFVDFDFHNCPFEQEIRKHFAGGMLYTQGKHFPLDPGFFDRTQQQQDKKFFYHLKVETD